MSEDQNSLDVGLPASFWNVPEPFIPDQTLRFLHSDLSVRLREDNPDADTLELMAIERVASLYIWMRAKESAQGFSSDASYKSIIQLWTTMAADLRKARTDLKTTAEAQAEIMTMLVKAINDGLAGVDPEIANTVKRRVMESIQGAGR